MLLFSFNFWQLYNQNVLREFIKFIQGHDIEIGTPHFLSEVSWIKFKHKLVFWHGGAVFNTLVASKWITKP